MARTVRVHMPARAKAAVQSDLHVHKKEISMPHESMQRCIKACYDCATSCDHCASACLAEKNVATLTRCIALDIDCAEACRSAAGLMSRGSELSTAACELCAQACDACAEECDRHDMDHCRECARVCRLCAEECRRMAGSRGAGRHQPGAVASPH